MRSTQAGAPAQREADRPAARQTEHTTGDDPGERPRLRLVHSRREPARPRREDEAGTTTAEYTVVTGAAVAFGALLFKLLTSDWGDKILTTAFKQVISLLGF